MSTRRGRQQKFSFTEPRYLHPDEWDFYPRSLKGLSDRRLSLWVNYEYARSSTAMREAVNNLRSPNQDPSVRTPWFARYLRTNFPGFPSVPFHKLEPESYAALEERMSGFDRDRIRVRQLEEFLDDYSSEDGGELPRDAILDSFYVLDVDFSWTDGVLVSTFKKLLPKIRAQQKCPKPTRNNKGQGNHMRVLQNLLKDLGAARLLKFCTDFPTNPGTSPETEAWNHKSDGESLLSDDKAWEAAQHSALYLLHSLKRAWNLSAEPPFPLRMFPVPAGQYMLPRIPWRPPHGEAQAKFRQTLKFILKDFCYEANYK